MVRFPALFVVAAFLVVLALPAPAMAAPAWLASDELSPDQDIARVVSAATPDGTAVVAWRRAVPGGFLIEARVRPPGGAFGPALTLSGTADLSAPEMAAGPGGTVVVVWTRGQLVEAAVRPPGGEFGTPDQVTVPGETVSDTGADVALDGSDAAHVVWRSGAGNVSRIRATRRPAGGSFEPPEQLASATNTYSGGNGNQMSVDLPHVAADGAGRAFAVWRFYELQYIGGNPISEYYTVNARTRQPGNTFTGSPAATQLADDYVDVLDVAASQQGTAVAFWLPSGFSATVQARVRPPEGPFGPIEYPAGASASTSPSLAVDEQGGVVAAWQRGTDSAAKVEASRRPAGGTFGASQPLSEDGVASVEPAVVATPDAGAIAAWRRDAGIPKLLAARRPPDGSFGPGTEISPPGQGSGDPRRPRLASDGEGNVLASWLRNGEGGRRVEYAAYDAAPPRLSELSVPPEGTTGAPLAFSVRAFDVWSPFTVSWDFGDGTVADGAETSHAFGAAGGFNPTAAAVDAVGNAATASGPTVIADPPPGGSGPVGTAVADTLAPVISAFAVVPARFAVRRVARSAAARRARRGTAFRMTVTEASTVTIAISRRLRGRRVGGRCVRPSRANRRRARCRRFRRVGALVRRVGGGTTRTAFSGRLRRRALRRGSYRAIATAVDDAGNRSRRRRASFRVVRR